MVVLQRAGARILAGLERLDLGSFIAFMLRDGDDVSNVEFEDVRVDLTGASPVVSISSPSRGGDRFRHLIGIMAPGLVIEPSPSAHVVEVGDDSFGVAFTTAVITTVRYAHAAVEIPAGVA